MTKPLLLVLLPLLWLAWYSITDDKGAPTLANFVQLVVDPSFVSPFRSPLGKAVFFTDLRYLWRSLY